MNLIGQYDSPFVRRVGIALKLYGLEFTHSPWSVFRDADKLAAFNPLLRVPVLVLDSGVSLIESAAILDYLDGVMPVDVRLFPTKEPLRHQAMRLSSLACGLADKAVSLFYEQKLHDHPSEVWRSRCIMQIKTTLEVIEGDLNRRETPFAFGENFGHADIALACAVRFLTEAHPLLFTLDDYRAMSNLCAKLEAEPVFKEIAQPFFVPT